MTPRMLTLTAALLALAGCATQQTGPDPTASLNQRLSSLEARFQGESGSNQALLGELGKKIEALSTELRQMQAAGQAGDGATAQQAARMEKMEQRLQELGAAQAALEQRAQLDASNKSLQADTIYDRLAADQTRLQELSGKVDEAAAQTGAVQAALREHATTSDSRLIDYDARLAALNKRLDEVERMAQDALDATGLGQHKIFGKVIESITLTEDKTLFPINSPDLGEEDKAKLDALAIRLKALGTNYHLQIQGHTDGFGAEDYNYELGKARAEVVKNYLNEKGRIPLLRMSVISYGALGASSYVGGNNRRIVVQVLQ